MTLFQIISDHDDANYIFSIGSLNSNDNYTHHIGRYKNMWTSGKLINVLKEL